jgi:hypothetical protein
MKQKIKEILKDVLLVAIICFAVIFVIGKIDYLSKLFSLKPEKQERVEDTAEYKQLQKEKEEALQQSLYNRGRYEQAIQDYQDIINKLPVINQNFRKRTNQIQNLKPDELNAEYQKEVEAMRNEIK